MYPNTQAADELSMFGRTYPKVDLDEYLRVIELLKKEVLKGIGGSLVNKTDHWEEYCKENNINY